MSESSQNWLRKKHHWLLLITWLQRKISRQKLQTYSIAHWKSKNIWWNMKLVARIMKKKLKIRKSIIDCGWRTEERLVIPASLRHRVLYHIELLFIFRYFKLVRIQYIYTIELRDSKPEIWIFPPCIFYIININLLLQLED